MLQTCRADGALATVRGTVPHGKRHVDLYIFYKGLKLLADAPAAVSPYNTNTKNNGWDDPTPTQNVQALFSIATGTSTGSVTGL